MKNLLLDPRTRRDIDNLVERVHRDMSHQGGHVDLKEVRELLKLDLFYYKLDDPGMLNEVVHKLKLGGKQVLDAATTLIAAVRKFELKALFVPKRRQIMIDETLPDLKKRWSEAHEIAHSVIPWHDDYLLGDNKQTLTPNCHERIEAEANYASGRLLFPAQEFVSLAGAHHLTLGRIREIAKHFGNTITSTMWRCVESDDYPCLGLIGQHPRRPQAGKPDVEHFIQSPAFAERFSKITEAHVTGLVRGYCGYQTSGPLGSSEIVICDDNGDEHIFWSETFCVKHSTLTLARHLRRRESWAPAPAVATKRR